MRALAAQIELHSDLLHNAVEGLSPSDLRARLQATNSISFLTTHLVHARVFLLGMLGELYPNPLPPELDLVQADDASLTLPDIGDLLRWWDETGTALAAALRAIAPETLEAQVESKFPTEDSSLAGAIMFLVAHEGYHIGQIGLLRRQLGKPSMSYARRKAGEP
jgi:uncharacterized damage-inducible protein DinB